MPDNWTASQINYIFNDSSDETALQSTQGLRVLQRCPLNNVSSMCI